VKLWKQETRKSFVKQKMAGKKVRSLAGVLNETARHAKRLPPFSTRRDGRAGDLRRLFLAGPGELIGECASALCDMFSQSLV